MGEPEEAAASVVEEAEYDLPIEEVDALLTSFSGDDPTNRAFAALPEAEAGTSREGMVEIERFLMDDMDKEEAVDGTAVGVDEFFDAVLVGDGESNGVPGPAGGGSVGGASTGQEEEVGVDGDDENNTKKKMRQVKNRDAAMKSRERKKLYVKDLEMKETPPLVSLLWLVCIVYPFLMPGVPNRNLVAPSNPERDLVESARIVTNGGKMIRMTKGGVKMIRMTKGGVKMTGMTINRDACGTLELIVHGRRCKGRRARMKFPWLP